VNLQKSGGIAAIFQAFAYVIGFAAMATVLNPGDVSSWTALEKLAYTLDRKMLFQLCNICIYVMFGIALVVLTLALHERLKAKAPHLMQIATALGLIWAGLVIASGMIANVGLDAVARIYPQDPTRAALLWLTISTIQDGLGGGVEVVGGMWLLLLSTAGLRTLQLSSSSAKRDRTENESSSSAKRDRTENESSSSAKRDRTENESSSSAKRDRTENESSSSAKRDRTENDSALLHGWGLFVGIAGLLTVLPRLADFGIIFGLGQIVWFAGIGVSLLRRPVLK
jgi:hypothetical protein